MKNYFTILLLFASSFCHSQNLVPNGNLEQINSCPTATGQLNKATHWINPSSHPTAADYFNQCAATNVNVPNAPWGYQPAHSGAGYSGITLSFDTIANFREYMEVQLTSPLIAGTNYHFEMYVSLANSCSYTSSAIGAYFSDTMVYVNNYLTLPFTPQVSNTTGNFITDTLGWTHISGSFVAQGGEKYLIIGNFNNDAQTDSLPANPNGFNYAYVYVDDISVTVATSVNEMESAAIKICPNPFTEKLSITTSVNETLEFVMYDITCKIVAREQINGNNTFLLNKLKEGLYIYELRKDNRIVETGKIIKTQ